VLTAESEVVEHKIQSTDAAPSAKNGEVGKAGDVTAAEEEETFDNFDSSPSAPRSKRLVVDLDPVPKFLKNLVEGWAPEGMIVSCMANRRFCSSSLLPPALAVPVSRKLQQGPRTRARGHGEQVLVPRFPFPGPTSFPHARHVFQQDG